MNQDFEKDLAGRDQRLEQAFRKWSAETVDLAPPDWIERAILAEFDRTTQTRHRRRWVLSGLAAAAALAAGWFGAVRIEVPRAPAPAAAEAPFIPLPYVVQPARYEATEVIRMSVPVEELMLVGVPVAGDPGAQAEADVLVGQDGRARAIRLVTITE